MLVLPQVNVSVGFCPILLDYLYISLHLFPLLHSSPLRAIPYLARFPHRSFFLLLSCHQPSSCSSPSQCSVLHPRSSQSAVFKNLVKLILSRTYYFMESLMIDLLEQLHERRICSKSMVGRSALNSPEEVVQQPFLSFQSQIPQPMPKRPAPIPRFGGSH